MLNEKWSIRNICNHVVFHDYQSTWLKPSVTAMATATAMEITNISDLLSAHRQTVDVPAPYLTMSIYLHACKINLRIFIKHKPNRHSDKASLTFQLKYALTFMFAGWHTTCSMLYACMCLFVCVCRLSFHIQIDHNMKCWIAMNLQWMCGWGWFYKIFPANCIANFPLRCAIFQKWVLLRSVKVWCIWLTWFHWNDEKMEINIWYKTIDGS